MPQDPPPQFIIHFRSGSCFEHSRAQLNMDQSDLLNNWTVKFVISCCVVSKQVEVTIILASVESTGSWLHACMYLSGVCALSSSRDIARYRSNSPILLHINQPAYFMERNMEYI